LIADPAADLDRARLCLVLLVHQPDEIALATLLDGPLRNEYALGVAGAEQAGAHELAWHQHALRVGDLGADHHGSGALGERGVGEGDMALVLVSRTIRQFDLDLVFVILRAHQIALGNVFAVFQDVVFRNGEVDPHRVERRDRGEQRFLAVGVEVAAFLHLGKTREPLDRTLDGGVAEIEFGAHDVGPRHLHCRRRGTLVAHGVVEVLFRHGVLLGQGPDAGQGGLGDLEPRLLCRQFAARRCQLRLEGLVAARGEQGDGGESRE